MIKVALIFGGQSSEHEVSCVSAATVAGALRRDTVEPVYIGITRRGHWILVEDPESIRDMSWEEHIDESTPRAILSPDTDHKLIIRRGESFELKDIDVAFPVLHGLFGEDGTIQGLFEMAHIPYVGCGHLSAAVTMDKLFTKIIADSINVDQARYVGVRDYELDDMDRVVSRVEAEREYPVFVKPSCAGSSMGITKAHNREELVAGLRLAAEHDSKILVEESISGRELECAVFGYGDDVIAAGIGEVLAAAEFYDYDAKYNNAESKTVIDPELPEGVADELMETAIRIFRACDGFGFARVDFFLEERTNRIIFNEINAIPGHTAISMYPMIMENAGRSMESYIEELIEMSFKRHHYDLQH